VLSKKTKVKYGVKKKKSKYPKITIQIFDKWCKRCNICVDLCSHRVLALDENVFPVAVNPIECNRCDTCVLRCPDFAIAITGGEKES
jgi:2-oxoglutarate ferredoxin oxidoreductase subunit delta